MCVSAHSRDEAASSALAADAAVLFDHVEKQGRAFQLESQQPNLLGAARDLGFVLANLRKDVVALAVRGRRAILLRPVEIRGFPRLPGGAKVHVDTPKSHGDRLTESRPALCHPGD